MTPKEQSQSLVKAFGAAVHPSMGNYILKSIGYYIDDLLLAQNGVRFNPTNISGKDVKPSTPATVASTCIPAFSNAALNSGVALSPYWGGAVVPISLTAAYIPDLLIDTIIEVAYSYASSSPRRVTFIVLICRFNFCISTDRLFICSSLRRRFANFPSSFARAKRSPSAIRFASAARAVASAIAARDFSASAVNSAVCK